MIYRGLKSDSRMLSPSPYPFFCLSPLNTKFYFDIEWQKPTAYVFLSKYQTIFASHDVIVVALPRFSDSKFPKQVKK